jgi:hypothetical protein
MGLQSYRRRRVGCLSVLPLVLLASAGTATADPGASNPPGIILPRVFCFRITDIGALGGNSFRFEFEVLNWTPSVANGVFMARNTGTSGFNPNLPPANGLPPFFSGAGVDPNGRPLGPVGDNANFQPLDGAPVTGSKVGAPNDWAVSAGFPTATAIRWAGGTAIPDTRDLVGAGSTAAACALVPGCMVSGGLPVIANPETIDNGGGTPFGGTNNVLDGFTIDVSDFNVGETLSFNWFLLNGNSLIGSVGFGSQFGFGVFNIFRVASPGPAIWCAGPPSAGICNTGTSTDPTYAFRGASLISQFDSEAGAGITGMFTNPADNTFQAQVNGQFVPEPSTTVLMLGGILAALVRRLPCRRVR